MTQASLLDLADTRTHFAAVKAIFEARPNQWVSALDLEQVGGRLSWRTRLSEVRRWAGMTIENRQPYRNGIKVSEYRWVP